MKNVLMLIVLVGSLVVATVSQATETAIWTSGSHLYYGSPGSFTLADAGGGGDYVSCPVAHSGGYVNAIPFQGSFPYTDPTSLLAGDVQQEADLVLKDGSSTIATITGGTDYLCNGIYHVTHIEITVSLYLDGDGDDDDIYSFNVTVWGEHN